MRLPIDTTVMRFIAAGAPEPVLDYETRAQKLDLTGRPMFTVHLFAIAEGSRGTFAVKVAGEPKGISEFTPVKITSFTVQEWQSGDRHGLSCRAEAIEPITAKAQA